MSPSQQVHFLLDISKFLCCCYFCNIIRMCQKSIEMGPTETSLSQTTVFIKRKKMKFICLLALKIDQGRWICRVTLSQRKTQFLRHKNICRNVSKHPRMLFLWQNENSEEKDRIARVTRQSLDSPSSTAFLPRQLMILGLETGPQGTTAGYLIFLMTDMHHWAQGSNLAEIFQKFSCIVC